MRFVEAGNRPKSESVVHVLAQLLEQVEFGGKIGPVVVCFGRTEEDGVGGEGRDGSCADAEVASGEPVRPRHCWRARRRHHSTELSAINITGFNSHQFHSFSRAFIPTPLLALSLACISSVSDVVLYDSAPASPKAILSHSAVMHKNHKNCWILQ